MLKMRMHELIENGYHEKGTKVSSLQFRIVNAGRGGIYNIYSGVGSMGLLIPVDQLGIGYGPCI